MAYYLLAGFSLGTLYPQICKNYTYTLLFDGIYRPHRDHHITKKQLFKNDKGLNEYHYYHYISDTTYSFYNMLYKMFYGNHLIRRMSRQNKLLHLYNEFGFVDETLQNFDIITSEIARVNKIMSYKTSPYKQFSDLEQKANRKMSRDSINELNIKSFSSLAKIDSNTTEDEYNMLNKAVSTVAEYDQTRSLENEMQDLQASRELAQDYEQAIEEWNKKARSEDFDEFLMDQRKKKDKDLGEMMLKNSENLADPNYQDRLLKQQQMSKKIDPKQLDTMKAIFGDKSSMAPRGNR